MVIHGYHAIEEYLRRPGSRGVLLLSRRGGRRDALEALARGRGFPVRTVADQELDRLCGPGRHRGAALQLEKAAGRETRPRRRALPPSRAPAEPRAAGGGPPRAGARARRLAAGGLESVLDDLPREQAIVLFLDEITDPHNLGAILRSADQFAVDLILIPAHGSARETDTVARVSSGASAHVPLRVVTNLVRAIEQCRERDFWIYGAEAGGEPAHRVDLKGRVGLVMGSEGGGLRRLVRERCDRLVAIPAAGAVQSFNVSVAAGILLYEIRRQQGFPYFSFSSSS